MKPVGGKVLPLEELRRILGEFGRREKRVVLTNGHFDLLHIGHLRYLQEAKALGDILVVGVNSDASTRRLKGPGRPILPQGERAELLAALACVDYVTVFEEDTAEELVQVLRPDVYVKGGDYAQGKPLPEAKAVAAYGGEVRILALVPDHSTSALLERIRRGI